MVQRPKPSLLHFAGYMLKLFAIWMIAFTLLLFCFVIFNARPLGDALIMHVGPLLLKFGATTFVLLVAGGFIESLR
ncbi:MAG: hypothetical protein WBA76_16550 [Phormidesmis sp.]